MEKEAHNHQHGQGEGFCCLLVMMLDIFEFDRICTYSIIMYYLVFRCVWWWLETTFPILAGKDLALLCNSYASFSHPAPQLFRDCAEARVSKAEGIDESESSQGTLSEQCHGKANRGFRKSPDRSISKQISGGIDLTCRGWHRMTDRKCSSMGACKELLWKLPDATSQELAVVAAKSQ